MSFAQRAGSILRARWFAVLAALVFPLLTATFWPLFADGHIFGVRLLSDSFDLKVYFQSSRWVSAGGVLYGDVFSEYPLLANLLFAAVRSVSDHVRIVPPGLDSFVWVWTSAAWISFVVLVRGIAKETSPRTATWLWLAPAPIYFGLYRYDVYAAALTFLCFRALRRDRVLAGCGWLGLVIALKGYALFAVPVMAVYLARRYRASTAVAGITATLAPLAVCTAAVYAYAGWSGVVMPYVFHAHRGLNNESTYDALVDLTRIESIRSISAHTWVAQGLQALAAITASVLLFFRDGTLDDLINGFLLAVIGFMTFSIFYSPQYLLWVLPIVCFSRSEWMQFVTVAFSWATFLYFPLIYDLRLGSPDAKLLKYAFGAAVAGVTFLRVLIAALTAYALRPNLTTRKTSTVGAAAG